MLTFLIMRLLLIALLLLAQNADKPRLETRVFPAMQTVNLSHGCSQVLMTAEIKGVEDEKWYCPKVIWELPDGTQAMEESDCVPFDDRYECYPKAGNECGLDWHIDPGTGSRIIDKNPCDCTIPGYPRVWRRRLCAPAHPYGEPWYVMVRMEKNDKAIAYAEIRFVVK